MRFPQITSLYLSRVLLMDFCAAILGTSFANFIQFLHQVAEGDVFFL